MRIADQGQLSALVHEAIREHETVAKGKAAFTHADNEFLLQEIESVILGQGIKTLEDYQSRSDRTGRGRPLGRQQRQQVWQVHEALEQLLRSKKVCLFAEQVNWALQNVNADYDYVFIDEAQDLSPVALRFCVGLCRNRKNVFVTADINQSIYGKGLSWSSVAKELRFQGRTRVLRRNYRTTIEIWDGIRQLRPSSENIDSETIESETVYSGPFPIYVKYEDDAELGTRLNAFLHRSLREERVAPGCAAVLCPTERIGLRVVKLLSQHLNPRSMRSRDLDLGHPGVKVLTMHAAKGLQFPIVAVVGVNEGQLPFEAKGGIDFDEHLENQRRLLFVACSRAMKRLLVAGNRRRPSAFLSGITDDCWVIEKL